jgi:hypothetical protein
MDAFAERYLVWLAGLSSETVGGFFVARFGLRSINVASSQDFQTPNAKPIAIYCLFGIVMFLASTIFHLFQVRIYQQNCFRVFCLNVNRSFAL